MEDRTCQEEMEQDLPAEAALAADVELAEIVEVAPVQDHRVRVYAPIADMKCHMGLVLPAIRLNARNVERK